MLSVIPQGGVLALGIYNTIYNPFCYTVLYVSCSQAICLSHTVWNKKLNFAPRLIIYAFISTKHRKRLVAPPCPLYMSLRPWVVGYPVLAPVKYI